VKDIYEYIELDIIERKKHVNLEEECVERGSNSTQCRGLLAYYLDTTVPNGNRIHCCHACHNDKCGNPKHLYWGTISENCKDRFQSEKGKIYRKEISDRIKGKNNPSFDMRPWETPKSTNKTKNDWARANDIYNNEKMTDFKKHGFGRKYLMKKYGINEGPARKMVVRFLDGWIPSEDKVWVEFVKNWADG